MDDHDQHIETMEACGKAFGFVISAALKEATSGKPFSPASFFGALQDLAESDRFSPDVSVVLGGVLLGVAAHRTLGDGTKRHEIV